MEANQDEAKRLKKAYEEASDNYDKARWGSLLSVKDAGVFSILTTIIVTGDIMNKAADYKGAWIATGTIAVFSIISAILCKISANKEKEKMRQIQGDIEANELIELNRKGK